MEEMKLPTDWNDITIAKWRELNSIETENEVSKAIQQISILLDIDSEEVRSLPIKQFQDLVDNIELFKTKIPDEVTLKFEIDGKKYGLIPDFNYITTGEFVDIENFKDDTIENIHLISAVIFRPVIWEDGDEYRIQSHKTQGFSKRANLFLNKLPITKVYGAVLFFLNLGISYSEIMMDYLVEEEMEKTTTTKETQ